jgi:hypothetical protein
VLKSLAVVHIVLALLTMTLAANVLAVNVALGQQQLFSGNEFYFHYKSQLYRNENSSIIGLEEANLSVPVRGTPEVMEVAAAIRNATLLFGTIWVGTVAWLTQPFAAPTVINGHLVFRVWLASNDSVPSFSGVGAGVAVIDEKGRQVGNYVYSYSYAQGSVLTPTPKEYTFGVKFNQEIDPDWKLIFAVGLGSTTVYWRMRVYFDSTDFPSLVQLPTNVTVIPEFTASSMVMNACVAIALSLTLLRRMRRKR